LAAGSRNFGWIAPPSQPVPGSRMGDSTLCHHVYRDFWPCGSAPDRPLPRLADDVWSWGLPEAQEIPRYSIWCPRWTPLAASRANIHKRRHHRVKFLRVDRIRTALSQLSGLSDAAELKKCAAWIRGWSSQGIHHGTGPCRQPIAESNVDFLPADFGRATRSDRPRRRSGPTGGARQPS